MTGRAPAGPDGADTDGGPRWAESLRVLDLFAIDPQGLRGVVLRGGPGPVRERWLAGLRERLPDGAPLRRLPVQIDEGRLLGGLDLSATLAAGRPVAARGLLAEADGGVVLVAGAERLPPRSAACIASALDRGEIDCEREGIARRDPARLGIVAIDEGRDEDERIDASLADRLALCVDLEGIRAADAGLPPGLDDRPDDEARSAAALASELLQDTLADARARLPDVTVSDTIVEALCSTALALGVDSMRAPQLALRAARAAAALDGRDRVGEDHARLAAALVLGWRATRLPAPEPPPDAPADAQEAPPPEDTPDPRAESQPPEPADDTATGAEPEPPEADPHDAEAPATAAELAERVLAAAAAALPPGLLARLAAASRPGSASRSTGRFGAATASRLRGRPIGQRHGRPEGGARLDLVATLRAAAPWQRLRRPPARPEPDRRRVIVHPDDLRIRRLAQRRGTTTVFLVDASGSAALHRLAEAKGAVELLLADCYVRRDRVALLAFRGRGAELLLPPTRSLTRARRSLGGLPGGGGTPLAAGLDSAGEVAEAIARRGDHPLLVLLSDCRANVSRDGTGGRTRAQEDALEAARTLRREGIDALVVDTSPLPHPAARELAAALGAGCVALPRVDARTLSDAVRARADAAR